MGWVALPSERMNYICTYAEIQPICHMKYRYIYVYMHTSKLQHFLRMY